MPIVVTLTHETEALQSLRDEWKDLHSRSVARGIALSWTWMSIWWKHFHNTGKLWLLKARRADNNQLVGIAPLMLTHVQPKVGIPWKRLEIIGSSHYHEHLDFIVEPGYEAEIIPLFIETINQYRGQWGVLRLGRLCDTPTIDLLQSMPDNWHVNPRQEIVSPFIQLPSDVDSWFYSVSKNRRKKQRRYLRYLNETYPDNWSITMISDHEHLDRAFDDLVSLHQEKWDATDKSGAFYQYGDLRDYYRELMHALLDEGWLRLYQMVVNGTTAVVLFSYHYRGRSYDQISGVHEIADDVPVGHVMTEHSIIQAIGEGADEYTFMWGNEPYKYSFGAVDRTQYTYDLIGNKRVQIQKNVAKFLRGVKTRVRHVSVAEETTFSEDETDT